MKRKYYLGAGIAILCLVIALIINITHFQKNEQKDAPVVLNTIVAMESTAVNTSTRKMEGWFADLLKEKLNIEVRQLYHSYTYDEEYKDKFNRGEIDLYGFSGSRTYYEQIEEGRLKNLEPYIEEHPEVYSRYKNVIEHIKRHTYKYTGKKGIYGLPANLDSFEDSREGDEADCFAIPSSAKHADEAMKLLTWSASEEGIMNIAFGPEGQMWKKEKGKYVLIKDWREGSPTEKVVKTKYGELSFYEAVCPMDLIGNYSLGKELIK